jgi:hypothetical protein
VESTQAGLGVQGAEASGGCGGAAADIGAHGSIADAEEGRGAIHFLDVLLTVRVMLLDICLASPSDRSLFNTSAIDLQKLKVKEEH